MKIFKAINSVPSSNCTCITFCIAKEMPNDGITWVESDGEEQEFEWEIDMGQETKLYRQAGVEYYGRV